MTNVMSSSPLFPLPLSAFNGLWIIILTNTIEDDLGVVSNALPSLSQAFNLSQSQQENVVGVLYLGSALGSAFGGFLCDYLGRKSGIVFTDVVFMVGALVLAFANSVPTLIIGTENRKKL